MGIFERLFENKNADGYIKTPSIIFVGEKTGQIEDEIKGKFTEIFKKYDHVISAYLAILQYESKNALSVGLCINSALKDKNETIIKEIGNTFKQVFNRNVFMDILFLTEEKETELIKVCKPFYKKA
jgi:hypothetical protein